MMIENVVVLNMMFSLLGLSMVDFFEPISKLTFATAVNCCPPLAGNQQADK